MKCRHVTPDAGYAWLILTASIVSGVLQADFYASGGVFFTEYTRRFSVSPALAAWIPAVKLLMMVPGSAAVALLLPRVGVRPLVVLCTAATTGGLLTSMFLTNIYLIIVSYGVFPGFGICTIHVLWMQVNATFFRKYRGLAFGLMVGSNAIGTTVIPISLQYLFSEYSWKGALLINAGIQLHLMVAGLIIPDDFGRRHHPEAEVTKPELIRTRGESFLVDVHMSVDTRLDEGLEQQAGSEKQSQWFGTLIGIPEEFAKSQQNKRKRYVSLTEEPNKAEELLPGSSHRRRNVSLTVYEHKLDVLDESSVSTTLTTSTTSSWRTQGEKEPPKEQQAQEDSSEKEAPTGASVMWTRRVKFFLTLTFLTSYGHQTLFTYLPSLGLEIGINHFQASAMLSTLGAISIVARPLMGFCSDTLGRHKGLVYSLCWIVYGLLMITLSFSHSFTYMIVNVLTLGAISSFVIPVQSPLLVEMGGPKVLAFLIPFHSLGIFTGVIIGGLLLEMTGTCSVVMVTGGVLQVVAGVLHVINVTM